MLSDDTEQSCLVIEAFLQSPTDPVRFQNVLAGKLRTWFLAIPPGIGLATVKACLRLLVGVRPSNSGVNSAGNGAAMRAPILGTLIQDPDLLDRFVVASSLITHRDIRAIDGARIMAYAVAQCHMDRLELISSLAERCESPEWKDVLAEAAREQGLAEFARSIGARGKVSGYVLQSTPVALYAWLCYREDPRLGMEELIRLGGDTDTTGAMLGALYGAALGPGAFPSEWLARISDWPRSVSYLRKLGSLRRGGVFWPASLLRNGFLLGVVLVHGFRRLVP